MLFTFNSLNKYLVSFLVETCTLDVIFSSHFERMKESRMMILDPILNMTSGNASQLKSEELTDILRNMKDHFLVPDSKLLDINSMEFLYPRITVRNSIYRKGRTINRRRSDIAHNRFCGKNA